MGGWKIRPIRQILLITAGGISCLLSASRMLVAVQKIEKNNETQHHHHQLHQQEQKGGEGNNVNVPSSTRPLLCNRAQVRMGSWKTSILPRAPYVPTDLWQKTCSIREGRNFSAPWKSYRWTPDDNSCTFVDWDVSTFCNILTADGDKSSSVEEQSTTEEASEDDGQLANNGQPLLFGRSDGWTGTTHGDGTDFCTTQAKGRSICNWDAYCPNGQLNQQLRDRIAGDNNNSKSHENAAWALVDGNGQPTWVSLSPNNACMQRGQIDASLEKIEMGYIMCCTDVSEGDALTISFVGDSTTFQHYSSMSLLLGLSVAESDQHASRKSGTSISKMACDGRVRLSYLRDDTLDMLHKELETQKSDIVVFNTGLHYRKDHALMGSINNTISVLEKWQRNCRLKDSRHWCLPILRTTVPGHPHCMNYTGPVNDLSIMEYQIQHANYTAFGGNNFFWWELKGQNQQVEDAFSRSWALDYEVMDAYDTMTRRPDGHQKQSDCVHYCLPGPPDLLSRMLLHTLVHRRSLSS